MNVHVYIIGVPLAVYVVHLLIERTWCRHCKRFSAKSPMELVDLLTVSPEAGVGDSNTISVRARKKTCAGCGDSHILTVWPQFCDQAAADIYRDELRFKRNPELYR